MVNLIKLTLRDLETNLIKDHHFFWKEVKITKFDLGNHHIKLAEGYGQLSWSQLLNRQRTAINPWRIYGGRQAGLEFLACMRTHSTRWGSLTVSRRPTGGRRRPAVGYAPSSAARRRRGASVVGLSLYFFSVLNFWQIDEKEMRWDILISVFWTETRQVVRADFMLAHTCSSMNYFMVHTRKFCEDLELD